MPYNQSHVTACLLAGSYFVYLKVRERTPAKSFSRSGCVYYYAQRHGKVAFGCFSLLSFSIIIIVGRSVVVICMKWNKLGNREERDAQKNHLLSSPTKKQAASFNTTSSLCALFIPLFILLLQLCLYFSSSFSFSIIMTIVCERKRGGDYLYHLGRNSYCSSVARKKGAKCSVSQAAEVGLTFGHLCAAVALLDRKRAELTWRQERDDAMLRSELVVHIGSWHPSLSLPGHHTCEMKWPS